MAEPAWTSRPPEPLVCAGSLSGHAAQRMNQMVKETWNTVCLDGGMPRTYGNPEGTDHREGAEKA